MKLKSLVTTALVAAGATLAGHSAQAALTYNAGDLFLGFRALGGAGQAQDIVLNIGQASLYNVANGATFTVGNLGADLTAVFTANWNTDRGEGNNVQWGVVGTTYNTGNDPKTLFVSQPASSPTELTGRSPSNTGTTISKFQGVATGYLASTENTSIAKGTIQSISDPNAWNSFFTGSLDFTRFEEVEGNFAGGVASADAALSFYQLNAVNGSPAIALGTFNITNAGVITYTAVPEPSSMALVGVAAAGLAIIIRGRRRASHD